MKLDSLDITFTYGKLTDSQIISTSISVIGHLLSKVFTPAELESTTDILGPGFTSYKIKDLLYGRTYIFTIRPLYGEVEGPITSITKRICKSQCRLRGSGEDPV